MEQTTNFENQSLNQNLDLITPPKNIFKILFFILLALVLVIISVLTTLLVTKNKELTLTKKTEIKTSATPTEATKEETNILKISDIQMIFPESWKVASVSGNSARILTDYKQYQVYLTLDLEKNSADAKGSYDVEGKANAIKTQYGEVYHISSGGGAGMTGVHLSNNFYIFKWDTESNQPVPTNLDGVWRPDDNVTSEILLDITKTAQPIN